MDPGSARKHLQKPFARDELSRWWGPIEDRLPGGRSSRALSWRPAFAFAAAGAAAACLLFAAAGGFRAPAPAPLASAAPLPPGPLRAAGAGAPLGEFPPGGALSLVLDDRSEIRSEGPAQLRLLENSGHTFEVKQFRGRVRYQVTPGGPRRWVIDSPLAAIEVVGTAFWVEAEAGRVRVSVERGAVLVRGERVPERVQRLGPGDEITLVAEAQGAGSAPASSAAPAASSAPAAPAASGAPAAAAAPRPWRELARKGDYRSAYAELGPSGVAEAAAQASIEELFALADVARFSGHPREAVAPLSRVAQRGGAQGALAAFTLGRIRMDQLGDFGSAAQDLEQAMAMGLSGGLRDDAAVRRVEALGRAGQADRASEAARALVAHNPALEARLKPWLRAP